MLRPTIFSSISKLQLIFNFLLSLMLRSKIFSSSFQHQPFYAQRSSQLPNIVDATLSDTPFTLQTSSTLRSKISFVFSHILPALMLRFRFYFHVSSIVPSLMLRSKNFSSIFKHVWCYALRYSLQLSTYLKLRSKIFTSNLKHQRCYAPRSSLQIFQHHWRDSLRSSFPFSDTINTAL